MLWRSETINVCVGVEGNEINSMSAARNKGNNNSYSSYVSGSSLREVSWTLYNKLSALTKIGLC